MKKNHIQLKRWLISIAAAALISACQSTSNTSDVLDVREQQPQAPQIAAETIGEAQNSVGFVIGASTANANDLRNGALLAQEQLADGKLSIVVLNGASQAWPADKQVRIAGISGRSGLSAPAGSVPIAIDSANAPAGGFSFVASELDSLEAGLRHAAANGGKVVIAAPSTANIAPLERLGGALGGSVSVVPFGQREGAASVAEKLLEGGPIAAIGFAGNDAKIVDLVRALKRSNPQVAIVGHTGWTSSLIANSALDGAFIARPDTANHALIAERYRDRFGATPSTAAFAGFDIVAIASGIVRSRGAEALTRDALLVNSGFRGATGAFRFRPDGSIQRLFEIAQIQSGQLGKVADAPSGF